MRYYSDKTKTLYDSVEDLEKAEKAITDRAAARKKDASEVEAAFNEMVKARKVYEEKLSKFCSKHGAYHKTITSKDSDDNWFSLSELLDLLKL